MAGARLSATERTASMQTQQTSSTAPGGAFTAVPEDDLQTHWRRVVGRRSFLKGVGLAGVAALPGSTLLSGTALASANELRAGDVAILRLLAAVELIESDLWQQYNELGGVNGGERADIAGPQNPHGDTPPDHPG